MNKKNIFLKVFIGILAWAVAFNSGCASLQKKFIRKKKDSKKEEFIPVLEPIEYGNNETSSIERYKYHLSMWKIWERDFMQVISEEDINSKRQDYLLNQMVMNLEEMSKWVQAEKKDQLTELIKKMNSIKKEFEKPVELRNMQGITSGINRIDKDIRNNFSADDVSGYLIQ